MNRTYYYLLPIVLNENSNKQISYLIRKKQIINCTLGIDEITNNKIYLQTKSDSNLPNCKRQFDGSYVTEFDIPVRYEQSVAFFIKGKYSRMYTPLDLKDLNVEKIRPQFVYKILTRDLSYLAEFVRKLKNSKLVSSDFIPAQSWIDTTELDIPPKINELCIYNFIKDSKANSKRMFKVDGVQK